MTAAYSLLLKEQLYRRRGSRCAQSSSITKRASDSTTNYRLGHHAFVQAFLAFMPARNPYVVFPITLHSSSQNASSQKVGSEMRDEHSPFWRRGGQKYREKFLLLQSFGRSDIAATGDFGLCATFLATLKRKVLCSRHSDTLGPRRTRLTRGKSSCLPNVRLVKPRICRAQILCPVDLDASSVRHIANYSLTLLIRCNVMYASAALNVLRVALKTR